MSKLVRKLLLIAFICTPLCAKDLLLELKTGVFGIIPGKESTSFFASELTFQLKDQSNWFGFVNTHFILGYRLDDSISSLGFGFKYFIPYSQHNFYVGLGLNPVLFNFFTTSEKWCLAPIITTKLGNYFHVTNNFFIDIYCDLFVIPLFINPVGITLGIGFGYRF